MGNHTLRAMRELGFDEADVYWIDVDEEEAQRLALNDNKVSDLAGWDSEELAALLEDLGDLTGTGFEQADLDELLDELDGQEPVEDDDVPELPVKPVTRPGELIALGDHRLVCGDARDPDFYRRLLQGETAELCWTDPPYGVDYTGRTRRRLKIANDDSSGIAHLLGAAFANVDRSLAPGSPLYVAHPSGPLSAVFMRAFADAGWSHRKTLIWCKDQFVLGRSDYQYAHEPILYGFKPGSGRLGRGGHGWYGGHQQSSVLEVPRPRASRRHPTAKPPELIAIALRNSSRRRALVLDPFAGSGSTLVACERLGRRARLLEIDPAYADVIVDRYEQLTGSKAVREGVD